MTHDLLDMTPEQLRVATVGGGDPAYRAAQLADWVYRKGVTDSDRMTNLPGDYVRKFRILTSRVAGRSDSSDQTVKLLLELHDAQCVETVLIPARDRATACLSTQVGCGMGCVFCASGLDGLQRNLSAGEILEQVLHLRQATGEKVTNAVFMGAGEPLANYDATVAAVRALIDPKRFALSARKVTVSTVGLPKQIRRLAGEDLPITLALSLHAPNDALRRELIPAAARFALDEILAAAETFYQSRKREITLEYALLAGVNDTNVCAEALAKIAHRLRCNVNLLGYNPVASLDYRSPGQAGVQAFARRLRQRGVNVNVRRSRGADADAACGQLRRRAARSD